MINEHESIEQARDIMISAIAQSMVIYGVTPSVGRIYGVLYFSSEPLTLDEIKEQVAMSKGSVSNGIRELLETEMITKVWKKGDRKDHYIAEKDYLRNFITFFIKKIRQERSLIMKAAEQVEPTLIDIANHTTDQHVKDAANKDLALIKDSHKYFDWTLQLANAMESGEIFKYLPKTTEE
ncbi:transcriptional regulator [Aquibacillus sp. 3ASR75-11]|uniref:HTH-type transcriptional regulator n=1 Tax=Terrihalobacillus insolitus TaxID=2950438 RepID=A0A9X3WUA4_9BACI|nr:transcriptional regulator [Terrihalobacillus insolitus]MDC3411882.1 transcriptional regulator [Terrihalobacillus insolitus]MDC3423439.1 transcriptional regulator [Terrihalobacillus insolitus]